MVVKSRNNVLIFCVAMAFLGSCKKGELVANLTIEGKGQVNLTGESDKTLPSSCSNETDSSKSCLLTFSKKDNISFEAIPEYGYRFVRFEPECPESV